jgi:mannosyltransferase OCH1-like enzyme
VSDPIIREKEWPVIPRLLHQVWVGPAPLPSAYAAWRDGLLRLHPGWEYRLWTDETVGDLPGADLLPLCRSLSSRANVVRLAAVAVHGGIYLDCDCEVLRPLDCLLVYDAFAAEESKGVLCNAVFGAVSDHPWVRWQLEHLPTWVSKPPAWGPSLMTAAPRAELTVVPKDWFYPFLWTEPLESRQAAPESLIVHHWRKSWKVGSSCAK